MEEKFPLASVENDVIISKDADLTVCFRVRLPEIFSLTSDDYDQMHSAWVKAIKMLPNFSVFHKQDWFYEDSIPLNEKDDDSFLSKKNSMHFFERKYLNHDCFVCITKTTENKLRLQSNFSALCRGHIIPKEVGSPAMIGDFLDKCTQFARVVNDTELIHMERLTTDEIVGTDDTPGLLDRYLGLSTGSHAVLEDMCFEPQSVRVGGKYLSTFALGDTDSLPLEVSTDSRCDAYSTDRSEINISFSNPVALSLNCNHIYNQYIFIEDSEKIITDLEKRKRNMDSLSAYSRGNAVSSEYIDNFLNLARSLGLPAVRAHFNVMIWDEDREKLKAYGNDTVAAFVKMRCTPRNNTVDCPTLYWAAMPGNEADFPAEERFLCFPEPAVCFFNGESNYQSSLSPFGMKMADRFGRPIHLDISDEPRKRGIIDNRNKFVLGPSGSGKSFFMSHLARQYYEQGTHILIVDTGHSYSGLCRYIRNRTKGEDGVYFTYTEENPIKFNPFYTDDYIFEVEKKESLVTLLLTLWKSSSEKVTNTEVGQLNQALNGYLEKITKDRSIRPCFNTFYEYILHDYKKILDEKAVPVKVSDFDVDNFLTTLEPYYKGGLYDFLLNSEENLDLLSKRFIVFEIDAIQNHKVLFPVVTIIIMETFINKMRRLKGIRKMIIIEEAWRAIAKANMAEFIKYLYKTVRKFFGEAVVVTQEVDDIISSPVVKESIIDNSDCKILMDMRKFMNKFEKIQENLGLTEKQKAQLLSVNTNNDPSRIYKEVWIGLGSSHSAVYATETSREEYLIYSTEEKEKMEVERMTEKMGGNIEKAVRLLADDFRERNK